LTRSSALNLGYLRATAAAFAIAPGAIAWGGPGSGGAAVFADRCAVCHGPQAAGIPGSFPSLHEQVVAFAKIPQGRDYLVMVVTAGLMGNLRLGGVNYNGAMPAQSGLNEAEVAAVLSFLASDLGRNEQVMALSPTEVAEVRARHPDQSAQTTRALRPATDL
jgi:mono/diheme cytochrome c family protein